MSKKLENWCSLSAEDCWRLYQWTSSAVQQIIPDAISCHIFLMLLHKTLRFRKYEEVMRNSDFMNGTPSMGILGLPYKRVTVWRHRKKLSENGLILMGRAEKHVTNRVSHVINFPALQKYWKLYYFNLDYERWNEIDIILNDVSGDFKAKGFSYTPIEGESVMLNELKDTLLEGKKTSDEALQRKAAKNLDLSYTLDPAMIAKMPKKRIPIDWILDKMKEWCEDGEAPFLDEWTKGKSRGQATNWVIQCIKDEVSPHELLYNVCRFWKDLYLADLCTSEGRPINLSSVVSFTQYYVYRVPINTWISEHKDKENNIPRFFIKKEVL